MMKRVLLIDSDPDSRHVYAMLLRHEGYEVSEATSGAEGVLRARELQPDVIVTELFVPTPGGWKVPELLRQDPRTAETPLIALSTHAFPEDEAGARAAGCNAYLAKPCEPSSLLREIERWLGGPREAARPVSSE